MIPTQRLLHWYQENARQLPWRQTNDPYAIWIAEVMLQQTRVETVIPYYQRWLQAFPNVRTLAAAPADQVLGLWEGLGYYRRAHHLRQAARTIVEQYGGQLPTTPAELEQLAGIGPYTAAAIGAIAFDADAVALDGNLRRVLSRLFDITDPMGSAEAEQAFRRNAIAMLPPGRASEFNQGLMDLGAMVCKPKAPLCSQCPLTDHCLARQRNVQMERPVRKPRRALPQRQRVAAVITYQSRVLLGRRPRGGLLSGLWEFPGGRLQEHERPTEGLARVVHESLGVDVEDYASLAEIEHVYTHYRVQAQSFLVSTEDKITDSSLHSEVRWVEFAELPNYPMGKVDRQIARRLVGEQADRPGGA